MDQELRRLIALAERIARTGERISLVFAAELATVWRRMERILIEEVGQVVPTSQAAALRDRVRAILTASGYDALVTAAARAGVEQMAGVVLGRAAIERVALETRLQALRQMATVDLFAQGDEVATAVWRAVVQQVIAERPVSDVLADLAAVLDKKQAQVATLFDTQVSIFGRQVEALKSADLPAEQPFLFAGPVDGKNRDFCFDLVGQVLTRDRIDALDNGQLPNVFLTAGGYNCRHQFIAVESKALRALANTGQRAPGYEAQIARVLAWRTAQKRRKAA